MGTTMPNFKATFTVYTVENHNFQKVASFTEAVRIARRLQAYGFKAHLEVEAWHNKTTPQAIASGKTFLFRPNAPVEIFNAYTNYFRKGHIAKSYYRFY